MCVSARIQFLIINRLHADDGRDPRMSCAFSRAKRPRPAGSSPIKYVRKRSRGRRSGRACCNVAGIEFGKNQHVRASRNLAVVQFAFGDFRHDCGSTCNSPSKSPSKNIAPACVWPLQWPPAPCRRTDATRCPWSKRQQRHRGRTPSMWRASRAVVTAISAS